MTVANFKPKNSVKIIGKVVDHDLALVQVDGKNGAPKHYVVRGKIALETEPGVEMSLDFYQGDKWKRGQKEERDNPYFLMLKNWVSESQRRDSGEEGPFEDGIGKTVSVDTAFSANAFVGNDGSLVEIANVSGGFIDVMRNEALHKSDYMADIFINKLPIDREDEETGEVTWTLEGHVFDYNKQMFPVKFLVKSSKASDFFTEKLEEAEGKGIFVRTWGKVTSSVIVNITHEENAFGEELEVRQERVNKENVVTGASPSVFMLNEEDNEHIVEEIKKGRANYETYLATRKEADNAIGESSVSKQKEDSASKDAGIKSTGSEYSF